jgi:hypothetical protein
VSVALLYYNRLSFASVIPLHSYDSCFHKVSAFLLSVTCDVLLNKASSVAWPLAARYALPLLTDAMIIVKSSGYIVLNDVWRSNFQQELQFLRKDEDVG